MAAKHALDLVSNIPIIVILARESCG
uniref:Uncharacterized protein n=1 Tax=Arundo donax TaxID=35708 RepID=A0A0A8YCR8_ARUDO